VRSFCIVALLCALTACAGSPQQRVALADARTAIDAQAKATVLIFTMVDCPISNRYAPEVRRLHEKFAPREVTFRLVYPNPELDEARVLTHLTEYQYPLTALLDPSYALVELCGATVTPEAAVFTPSGELVYRGRIDNRFVAWGKTRPRATQHDVEELLESLLEGKVNELRTTEAVGCFIPERDE